MRLRKKVGIGLKKRARDFKHLEREREREHNLEKLSFICDAQNKYEYINKTDYFAIFELIVTKQLLLQDSLFY